MSFLFGITYNKPSRQVAKQMNNICRDEGGTTFIEVNLRKGSAPDINHGGYQGWFVGPNFGAPFNNDLRDRVMSKCRELGIVFDHD